MDSHLQRKIMSTCRALLERNRNAADASWRRKLDILSHPPKTKKEAIALLLKADTDPNITMVNITDALWIVYQRSRPDSETRQWVMQLLHDLGRADNITASDAVDIASTLYALSPHGSSKRQEGATRLLALARRKDIPFSEAVEAAHALYMQSLPGPQGAQERLLARQELLAQARWPDITVAQAQEAATALCHVSGFRRSGRWSQDDRQGILVLIELAQRPDLSFEDAIALEQGSVDGSTKALRQQYRAVKKQMWERIAAHMDLNDEQRVQVMKILERYQQ